jgi:hypothetical protein
MTRLDRSMTVPEFLNSDHYRQQQLIIKKGPLAGHILSLKGDNPWA